MLFLYSCHDQQPSESVKVEVGKSNNSLNFLYTKLSGKSFEYIPGIYNRDKTVCFFIDKENDVFKDSIVSSVLADKRMLATDSALLKTVILIFSNKLPIDRLIGKKEKVNPTGFQICYVDLATLSIKKIVSIDSLSVAENYRQPIAKKIIETF
jgi:hypothetical protein